MLQRYNLLSISPNLWRIILWLTTMIFFFQSLDFFLPLSNYLLRFCHLLLQLPASIFDRLNLIILSQIDTTFLTPCAHKKNPHGLQQQVEIQPINLKKWQPQYGCRLKMEGGYNLSYLHRPERINLNCLQRYNLLFKSPNFEKYFWGCFTSHGAITSHGARHVVISLWSKGYITLYIPNYSQVVFYHRDRNQERVNISLQYMLLSPYEFSFKLITRCKGSEYFSYRQNFTKKIPTGFNSWWGKNFFVQLWLIVSR